MKYTCLNCYKKKDIDKMRNKTVCNRCFKKEIKKNKRLINNNSEKARMESLIPSLEYDKEYLESKETYRGIRNKDFDEVLKKHGDDKSYSGSKELKVSVLLKCDNCKEEFLIYNLYVDMFCWGSKNWVIDEYREKDYIFCPLCFHNPNNGEKERLIEVVRYRIFPRIRI